MDSEQAACWLFIVIITLGCIAIGSIIASIFMDGDIEGG